MSNHVHLVAISASRFDGPPRPRPRARVWQGIPATSELRYVTRNRLLDLHQIARPSPGANSLGSAPMIHVRGVVHAGHRTSRRAGFLGDELAADVLECVALERLGRVAALL